MKTARILVGLSLLFSLVVMVGLGKQVMAMFSGAKVSLSTSIPSTSSNHTYIFTIESAGNYKEFRFQYCQEPNPDDGCTAPAGMDLTGETLSATGGNVDANWTIDTTTSDANLVVLGRNNGTGEAMIADDVCMFTVTGITNHAIGDCNSSTSTDTCYVRFYGYSAAGASGLLDSTYASATVVARVTVSARINPTFTFVVTGVNTGTVHNQITTSVSSAYNTLPFSNLVSGTPKYAAHQLTVTTNSVSGYSISMKMTTQLTGTYAANNVDKYANGSAWGTPVAWLEPTGTTPNTDTGWIGANTTDTDISGWTSGSSPQGKFGPVPQDGDTAVTVMSNTASDNGSYSVYVSYALEVNTKQPSDTYTGYLIYNALPTY